MNKGSDGRKIVLPGNNLSSSITRRTFLTRTLAAATVLLTNSLYAPRITGGSNAGDVGVASGDPRADSVVLWTRVPDAHQPSGVGSVQVNWEISTSEGFEPGSIVQNGSLTTGVDVDFTVKVKVSSLQPFTRYSYRFYTDSGYHSVIGRTRTAAAADAVPDRVRIAYISCENYTEGYYTVLAALARDDVDFCVSLGDNIYEYGGSEVRDDFIGEVVPERAITLNDFRNKYKLYFSDPNLREVRRLFPWIVIWDDHEVFNDYAGQELTAEERAIQVAGYEAFREFMPIDPDIPLTVENGIPSLPTYRRFSFGQLLEVFALDERQYRDGPPCSRTYVTFGCPELYDPTRTMLGREQLDWLKNGLATSPARWKLLLSEVMMMALKITNAYAPVFRRLKPKLVETNDGLLVNTDQWDGYPVERTELLEFIRDEGISNVVVLTGDIHNCYAGVLWPDFTQPQTPSVAVEIVGGSVSSNGIAEYAGGRDLTNWLRRLAAVSDPHIQYLNAYYHVYTRVDVTPEATYAAYIAVDTVTEPTASSFELQRFTVPEGTPNLIVERVASRFILSTPSIRLLSAG